MRWSPDPHALGAGPPRGGPRMPEAALWREGEGWGLAFEGRTARLPGLAGLADLSRLVARPGEPVHCLDLARLFSAGETGAPARRALEAGMRELHEELAEAGASRDPCRHERARAELDRLAWALSGALGLDGGAPAGGDAAAAAARTRDAVVARIAHALRKVEAVLPALGRHLAESVSTGTLCVYRPARIVRWRVGPGGPGA